MLPQDTAGDRNARLAGTVLEAIAALAAGAPAYGLLDLPYHGNIGDSAIFLGEAELLRRVHGRDPDYVSTMHFSPEEPRRFLPEGILYLHGGGNFGDIWPQHQLYREAILQRYPGHRIVQLPQSLHYGDPAAVERTRRAIAAHRDFHMMVRDQESFDFAAAQFDCAVLLVPDCAFGIDMARVPRSGAGRGVLCIFRQDHERRDDADAAPAQFGEAGLGARIEDWNAIDPAHWKAARRTMRIADHGARLLPHGFWTRQRLASMTRLGEALVLAGFAQLDSAELIVTDRLHGHIMASLLGKPHVVIDNFYGKIAHFIRAWPAGPEVGVARDYAEARVLAERLLAREPA
jgi:pyruvyl transferase EpsO